MKKLIFILTLFVSFFGFSQEIKFEKGIIKVDNIDCLNYISESNNISYQSLNGDDIIFLKYIRVDGELYTKIIFVEYNLEFTSQSYIFTKKDLLKKLISSKTLVNCLLVEEKVRNFVLKYDEKVEERLNNKGTNTIIIKEEPRKSGININIGG